MEMEPPPQDATPAPNITVIEPPFQELSEDIIQAKIDNIQRIQMHLRDFMNQFQSGENCPVCRERLNQGLGTTHIMHHIRNLDLNLDTLYALRAKQPRIKSPKKKVKSCSKKISKVSPKEEDNKPRVEKKDEVRTKMWKRIYGRKKYQNRNTGREVTVSEEEIDAEIKRDALRNSGSGPGSGNLLLEFVDYKSAEYKLQKMKARDRLAKRILSKTKDMSSYRNISIADVEAEMLLHYMRNNPRGPPGTRNLANEQENNQANERVVEVEKGRDNLKMEIDPAIMDPFFSGDINMEVKAKRSVQESVQEDILDLNLNELIAGADLDD